MEYVVFGAGRMGKAFLEYVGKESISFFVDNNPEKTGEIISGVPVFSFEKKKSELKHSNVVIAVGDEYLKEIIEQLNSEGISNYIQIDKARTEINKRRIMNRIDYVQIYNKAIGWIKCNSNDSGGVIVTSKEKGSYPEVTGYLIPTLIRWGYRELAISYAKWLVSVQNPDGSWNGPDDEPYIFDTAQVLKGLIAVRAYIHNNIDRNIKMGCDWIIANMSTQGRLLSPRENDFGDGKTFHEIIHLYCLSPLEDASKLYNKCEYHYAAERILDYYLSNEYDKIMSFDLLSHFYGYVMEALIDVGKLDLAREAMGNLYRCNYRLGIVPGYNNVDWICSVGLFQLAIVWYRLGDIDKADSLFKNACGLQNASGGWYGSYSYNSANAPDYFPDEEISWANKYFLDALYYKCKAHFDDKADTFKRKIERKDGRYTLIKSIVEHVVCTEKETTSVLDVGCGKGAYLNNLIRDISAVEYYAVDLSERIMGYVNDSVKEKKQGLLTNIPFPDDMFSVTYACEALEHAIDVDMAIKEMARVTKTNGFIVVIDKNNERLGDMEIDECEQWFDENELSEIISKYCEDVRVEKEVPYEIDDYGLFYAWIGRVRDGL